MLTDAERTQLRTDVEATLPDRCNITRASTAPPVFDPGTGASVPAARTVLYTAMACRATAWAGQANVVQAGEQPVTLRGYDVTLPVSVDGLRVNDLVEMTQSEDAFLVGKDLRVKDPKGSSLGVQRRITAELNLG